MYNRSFYGMTLAEVEQERIKGKVYDALATISNEQDASEEDMKAAIKYFLNRFYPEDRRTQR